MYLVCWNHGCRQTYPASDFKVDEKDVKCAKCGGILISPSGKVQISQNPQVIPTIDPDKARSETSMEFRSSQDSLGRSRSGQVDWVGVDEVEHFNFEIMVGDEITFDYTNWKGKKSSRSAIVEGFYFGNTEYHTDKQWLLKGYDLDKESERVYSMSDMSNVKLREVF